MVSYSKELIRGQLEAETGMSSGYVENGGLSITRSEDRMAEFRYVGALHKVSKWRFMQ